MTRRDYKLFFSIVLWSVLPFVYYLIRMNVVSVSGVDINILGQMEWFDLMDEVIVTTFTVPLYYLLKPDKSCKKWICICFVVWRIFCVYSIYGFSYFCGCGIYAGGACGKVFDAPVCFSAGIFYKYFYVFAVYIK